MVAEVLPQAVGLGFLSIPIYKSPTPLITPPCVNSQYHLPDETPIVPKHPPVATNGLVNLRLASVSEEPLIDAIN